MILRTCYGCDMWYCTFIDARNELTLGQLFGTRKCTPYKTLHACVQCGLCKMLSLLLFAARIILYALDRTHDMSDSNTFGRKYHTYRRYVCTYGIVKVRHSKDAPAALQGRWDVRRYRQIGSNDFCPKAGQLSGSCRIRVSREGTYSIFFWVVQEELGN